jgi:hypothetical protein
LREAGYERREGRGETGEGRRERRKKAVWSFFSQAIVVLFLRFFKGNNILRIFTLSIVF